MTLSPARMTALDAEAVYAAGWGSMQMYEATGTGRVWSIRTYRMATRGAPDWIYEVGR